MTRAASERPKLSFCIPTFNREGPLRELLESLVTALGQISAGEREQIEVLISDNASADRTQSVIADFQSLLPNCRAWRNSENIGEDNFGLLLREAQGEYRWVFGDDDRLPADTLARLLPRLGEGHGIILLNYSIWSGDFSHKLHANARGLTCDDVNMDADQLMARHGIHLCFITAVILHRRLQGCVDQRKHQRHARLYCSALYYALSGIKASGQTSRFCNDIFVENRTMPVRYDWFTAFEGFCMGMETLAREGYSARAMRAARRRMLVDLLLIRIGIEAREGTVSRRILLRMGARYYSTIPLYWCLVLPIVCAPASLIRLARRGTMAYLRLRRPGFRDLRA